MIRFAGKVDSIKFYDMNNSCLLANEYKIKSANTFTLRRCFWTIFHSDSVNSYLGTARIERAGVVKSAILVDLRIGFIDITERFPVFS